ncbi:MAG: hypothetical protein LAT82_02175 [Nanoarchaeota archaeon]|nr:hypothetical protein [Nanoarchaeota archaeon]
MNLNNKKIKFKFSSKSQGEIFGIMLFFVILVLGFFLYSEFRSVYTVQSQNEILISENEIIAQSMIEHLKTLRVDCYRTRTLDGVRLLNLCVDNTGLTQRSHNITCESTSPSFELEVCSTFLNLMNSSLHLLFNGTTDNEPLHSPKAFTLRVIPSNDIRYSHLNVTMDNLQEYDLSLNISEENYYLRRGYSRVSSEFQNIPTNQGRFEFELSFYYRR